MSTRNELKVLHDQLLASKPEEAAHDEATCPLCAMETVATHDTNPGGSMPETFSQEDVEAAVAAATTDLQKRLEELGAQVRDTEVGRAVADALATKDTEVSELQAQLDAAEAARTAAENKLTEVEQFWADAITAHEEEATFAARREQRVTEATEAGVFSDDYIGENADRFAAMSDEDFKARLDEWKVIASKAGASVTAIPSKTALTASRVEDNQPATALAYIGEMRRSRIDPRTLVGGN
jgi:hypothetical protein